MAERVKLSLAMEMEQARQKKVMRRKLMRQSTMGNVLGGLVTWLPSVFILGKTLRSDGVRATVFKQVKGTDGSWVDAARDGQLDRDVEDSILTRARELKINSLPQR